MARVKQILFAIGILLLPLGILAAQMFSPLFLRRALAQTGPEPGDTTPVPGQTPDSSGAAPLESLPALARQLGSVQLLVNTGFETNEAWRGVNDPSYSSLYAHSGLRSLRMDAVADGMGVYQMVTIPNDISAGTLSFFWMNQPYDVPYDYMKACLLSSDLQTFIGCSSANFGVEDSAWHAETLNLSAVIEAIRGQQIAVYFYLHSDALDPVSSYFVDNVTLNVSREDNRTIFLPAIFRLGPVSLISARTGDGNSAARTAFLVGQPIRYLATLDNQTGAAASLPFTVSESGPCGKRPITSGTLTTAIGRKEVYVAGVVPDCPGAHTYAFSINYGGTVATKSAAFTVAKPQTGVVLHVNDTFRQLQGQWCFAAASQTIFDYYDLTVSQCTIANYALERTNCCTSPSSCNSPADVRPVLYHWGFLFNPVERILTFQGIQSEIGANRPFLAGWRRPSGGGHLVVVRGYDTTGTLVHYIDPHDGSHAMPLATFISGADSNWSHTWWKTVYQIRPR